MRPSPDFVDGNTRLRARLPVLAALASETDPETRRQQGRKLLRSVPHLYTGTARTVVSVLLARHDLVDTMALLRGAVRDRASSDRLAAVAAVGALDAETAADAAHAVDGRAALDRLAARHLPSPEAAAATAPAWERYELHGDVEELEVHLACAAHLDWERRLAGPRSPGRPVLELLRAERDLTNLATVLRVPWPEHPRLLPHADLGRTELAAASRGDLVPTKRARADWRPVLGGLGPAPRAVAVERALLALLSRRGGRMLRRGDVFGAEIAVGFVLVVEQLIRSPTVELVAVVGPARPPAQPGGRRTS